MVAQIWFYIFFFTLDYFLYERTLRKSSESPTSEGPRLVDRIIHIQTYILYTTHGSPSVIINFQVTAVGEVGGVATSWVGRGLFGYEFSTSFFWGEFRRKQLACKSFTVIYISMYVETNTGTFIGMLVFNKRFRTRFFSVS